MNVMSGNGHWDRLLILKPAVCLSDVLLAAGLSHLSAAEAWRGCKEGSAWPQPVCRPCGCVTDPTVSSNRESEHHRKISWNAPHVQKCNPNTMSYHQPLVRTVNSFCLAGDSLQPIIAWRVRRRQAQLMLRVDAALKRLSPPRSCEACALHCCPNQTSQRRTNWGFSAPSVYEREDIRSLEEKYQRCVKGNWVTSLKWSMLGANHQHTGINIGAEDFNQAVTVRGDNTENLISFVCLWLQITHKQHECAVTVSTLMLWHSGELADLTNWQLRRYTIRSIKK